MPRSRVERQLAAERVADHADLYEQDKNPLRAWLTYHECRRHRVRIPDWTLEYFDGAAGALAHLAAQTAPARPPAILKALGMTYTRGTVFSRLKTSDRDLSLAFLYAERRARRGGGLRLPRAPT